MKPYIFVSGARETDYPTGEEGSQELDSGLVDKSSLSGSMNSNSSAETDSLLGGITVVGCTAEGIAGPSAAHSANGASPETNKQPGMKTFTSFIQNVVCCSMKNLSYRILKWKQKLSDLLAGREDGLPEGE